MKNNEKSTNNMTIMEANDHDARTISETIAAVNRRNARRKRELTQKILRKCRRIAASAAIMAVAIVLGAVTGNAEEIAPVGSYVTFGTYPQTSGGDDATPIEWLVLARDGNKALLLSRYGLDAQPYNEEYEGVTWETCTLRTWLNGDFINVAFTSEEQAAILVTDVDNSDSQGYSGWDTDGGNDTQDKIFLLSYAEANQYLGVTLDDDQNTSARVAVTRYAIAQGAYGDEDYKTAEGEPAEYWWLRSPGDYQDTASIVQSNGSLYSLSVDYVDLCVRSALWVDLDAGTF